MKSITGNQPALILSPNKRGTGIPTMASAALIRHTSAASTERKLFQSSDSFFLSFLFRGGGGEHEKVWNVSSQKKFQLVGLWDEAKKKSANLPNGSF